MHCERDYQGIPLIKSVGNLSRTPTPGYWQRFADASGRAVEAKAVAAVYKKRAIALVDAALADSLSNPTNVTAQDRLVTITGIMINAEATAVNTPHSESIQRLADLSGRTASAAALLKYEKIKAQDAGCSQTHGEELAQELVDLEMAEMKRAASEELTWTMETEAGTWAAVVRRMERIFAAS